MTTEIRVKIDCDERYPDFDLEPCDVGGVLISAELFERWQKAAEEYNDVLDLIKPIWDAQHYRRQQSG